MSLCLRAVASTSASVLPLMVPFCLCSPYFICWLQHSQSISPKPCPLLTIPIVTRLDDTGRMKGLPGHRESFPSSCCEMVSEVCSGKVFSPGENTCYEKVLAYFTTVTFPLSLPSSQENLSQDRPQEFLTLKLVHTWPTARCQNYY